MDINNRSMDIPQQDIKITTFIPKFAKLRTQAIYNKNQLEDFGIDKLREIAERNLASRLVKDIMDNVKIEETELVEENKIMFSMKLDVLIEEREIRTGANKNRILNLIDQLQNDPHSFKTATLANKIQEEIIRDEILIG